MGDEYRVRLTEEDVARAIRGTAGTWSIASEHATRFALPHERDEVASRIDPDTATVFFIYAHTLDPYGDDPDLPPELQQVGREFFAVDPVDGVAVLLYDLPPDTREALEGKRRTTDAEGWRRLMSDT